MKKVELIYFRGCPSVPAARTALSSAQIAFTEVIQDELPPGDPKRSFCSPSLLVDGQPFLGGASGASSCSIERWDTEETRALLLGLEAREPSGCCLHSGSTSEEALTSKQKLARIAAGVGFFVAAYASFSVWPLALILAWFGISHLVAGVTAYPGCPELGAVPSVFLGRDIATRCRPWRWVDSRLRLR